MLKENFKIRSQYFIFLSFLLIINGCATASRRPSVSKEIPLNQLCERQKINWQWDTINQIVWLSAPEFKAGVLINSPLMIFQGEGIVLSAPVRIKKSVVVVPADFERILIERLAKGLDKNFKFPLGNIRYIILDPGHGGKDPGAIGVTGVEEKDIVLDITKRLKKILEGYGISVKMTRETDEFISLQERTEIASRLNADLFVSIHANSSPERNVDGIEVFSLRDLGYLEKNEAQRKDNHRLLFGQLAMKKHHPDLENILSDLLYSHKQAESPLLADFVAEQTAQYVETSNRGLKDARFYVLRNTLIPAILVEVGFLSNPREEKFLKTSIYRQKVASGLARSIVEYSNR